MKLVYLLLVCVIVTLKAQTATTQTPVTQTYPPYQPYMPWMYRPRPNFFSPQNFFWFWFLSQNN